MPSTLIHVAFAGLVGAGLLGRAFDWRAVLVVLAIAAVPDLDSFFYVIPGGHRSVLHTLLIPLGAAVLLYLDTRGRERLSVLGGESWLRRRYGWWGVRVAWVGVAVYAFAGIGLDLVMSGRYGGVNLLYPVHDQFYRFDGRVFYSTERGLVQTFVEFGSEGVEAGQRGSSEDVTIATPVDPEEGDDPETVERIFPIAAAGWEVLVVATSSFVLSARLWEQRRERSLGAAAPDLAGDEPSEQ